MLFNKSDSRARVSLVGMIGLGDQVDGPASERLDARARVLLELEEANEFLVSVSVKISRPESSVGSGTVMLSSSLPGCKRTRRPTLGVAIGRRRLPASSATAPSSADVAGRRGVAPW